MTEHLKDVRVLVANSELDRDQFLAQLRAALFGIYQVAQWWGLPDRYHFGVRARGRAGSMKSDVGPFTIMPEWVMRSGVSNSAIAVYAALGLHADKDTGEAWPSRERIAGLVGLSTRQVSNLLRELEAAGAVQTDLESRQGSSNAYRIVFAQPLNSVARGVEPDFKAPLETDFNQNQNHLEPESGTSLAPTSSARKRDEVWDVLVQIYGEPTTSGKGAMNAAAKTLRDYGALPAEIAWMAGVLGRTDLGWAVVTPTALAKYFGERQALVAQLDKKPFDRAAAIANGSADG